MENIIYPGHSVGHRTVVPHVPNIEFYFGSVFRIFGLQVVTHIILLLFITGKNTNLPDIGGKKMFQYSMAETAGTTGNQQGLSIKRSHGIISPVLCIMQYYVNAVINIIYFIII